MRRNEQLLRNNFQLLTGLGAADHSLGRLLCHTTALLGGAISYRRGWMASLRCGGCENAGLVWRAQAYRRIYQSQQSSSRQLVN